MSEAPHKWPWPRAWRLTCQGHSPSSAFVPPTTRACLVKDRSPQSGEGTENQSAATQRERDVPYAQGDSAQESPLGVHSNTRAEVSLSLPGPPSSPIPLSLPHAILPASASRPQTPAAFTGLMCHHLLRNTAQSTAHGDIKATQLALLGTHKLKAWVGGDKAWAAGLFVLQATHPWLPVCLGSHQYVSYVPEVLTYWLPTELCVCAKW